MAWAPGSQVWMPPGQTLAQGPSPLASRTLTMSAEHLFPPTLRLPFHLLPRLCGWKSWF